MGETVFGSRTVVEFDSLDRQTTWVDVQPDELLSVHLNEQPLDVGELRDGRFHLSDLAAHNVLVVEATMAYSHDGEGLHRTVDPEDGLAYVYAMTFLPAAPRVFACFDQPDLKAPYSVRVVAPVEWTVLGNTRSTQVEPGVWTLADTLPLSTYFVTLVAGPYHSITRTHDSILLGLHCRQSLAPHLDKDADELFTVTGQCFDEYHRLFDIRYPFGDYHQVFVPEFNAGAMENPGCVTFTDDFVFKAQATDSLRASRAYVIAHEMAHQWFGDLVTMRWWDDLWLNESFATYMGLRVTSEATRFDDIWVEYALNEKAWGLAADQRGSTHPVAGNGARDTQQALTDFDGISYSKGASVLRQLNAYLGDQAFLAGVVDHLRSHSYGNATLSDLLASWQRASDDAHDDGTDVDGGRGGGKDVHAWATAWLRTAGVDTLTVSAGSDDGVWVDRVNGSSEDVARPHAFTVGWYADDAAVSSVPVLATGERTPVDLPSYDGSGLLLPDSGGEAWAKIRLDPGSVSRAAQYLTLIDDPVARATIWGALREAMLDATVSPEVYLDAMERALPGEADLAVDKIVGNFRVGAVTSYGPYLNGPEDRLRLAVLAEQLLDAAAPSSNRQVIAARALVTFSRDAERLGGWLDSGAPDGLLVDEDLRWRLVRALCELGARGPDDIEAERVRDRSSQGAEWALRCRASLPDPAVKAEVWDSITTDQALTNYGLYALCDHFFSPTQVELTEPYVERFFSDVPATATFRTGMMVDQSASRLFPEYAVAPDTLALSEACLAGVGLTPGTRRAIADRTDDLRRALASRLAFPRSRPGDGGP
jgi:aminopeptidase N